MAARKARTRATVSGKAGSRTSASKRKPAEGGKATAASPETARGGKAAEAKAKASKKKAGRGGRSARKKSVATRRTDGGNKSRLDNAVSAPVAKADGKASKQDRKPVRDSFTMPAADFALIARLKARTLEARRETKKSELLRAGLHVLEGLDVAALINALNGLTPIKVGRPSKRH